MFASIRICHGHSFHISPPAIIYYRDKLIAQLAVVWKVHESRLNRPIPSSYTYTSAVVELILPATMTHPPNGTHAPSLRRGSCNGGNASHCIVSIEGQRLTRRYGGSAVPLTSTPPKTAKRPLLNMPPPPPKRPTLIG